MPAEYFFFFFAFFVESAIWGCLSLLLAKKLFSFPFEMARSHIKLFTMLSAMVESGGRREGGGGGSGREGRGWES